MAKRRLNPEELALATGGSVQATLGTFLSGMTGMVVGAWAGGQIGHHLHPLYIEQTNQSQIKSFLIDSFIQYHLSDYGIENQTGLFGCLSGTLIGSIMSTTAYTALFL